MKLVAPEGFVSTAIDGTDYTADEDGNVIVHNEDHAAIMLTPHHGFKYHPDDADEYAPVPESAAPTPEELKAAQEAAANEPPSDPENEDGDDTDEDDQKNQGVTEGQVREMNKADLIDFIEERGGEIEGKPSKDELIDQAIALLNA